MACIIGTANRVLTGSLTAGSSATAVTNLANQYAGVARSWSTATGVTTPAGGAWMVVDSGSALTTWQAFGLFRTNLSASSVVTWAVGPNSSGASPVYSATTQQCDPAYGQVVHVAPSSVAGRYLRIEITDSAAAGNVIRAAFLYAGPVLQPAIGRDYSSAYNITSGEIVTTTRGGIEQVTETWQARTATASFSGLTEDEADALRDLDGEARSGMNCLLVPETVSSHIHQETIFGRMQIGGTVGYAATGDRARTAKLTFSERVG